MKTDRGLIYQLAGVAMIVGSFFAAAQAIGGLLTIIYIAVATDFRTDELGIGKAMHAALLANHIPAALSGVTSFLILLFGGRWMLRRPRLIERWMSEGRSRVEPPPTE